MKRDESRRDRQVVGQEEMRETYPLDQLHQGLGLELLDPGFVHTRTVVHLGLLFCFTHTGRGVFWNNKRQQFATCSQVRTGWPRVSPLRASELSAVNRAGALPIRAAVRNLVGAGM